MNSCPVCGYDKLSVPAYENIANFSKEAIETVQPPYEDIFGKPSYEVCPQCGFEFGNDDNPGTIPQGDSFESYRQEWKQNGSKWFDESAKTD